jgi:hypothetical protein
VQKNSHPVLKDVRRLARYVDEPLRLELSEDDNSPATGNRTQKEAPRRGIEPSHQNLPSNNYSLLCIVLVLVARYLGNVCLLFGSTNVVTYKYIVRVP